MATDYVINIQDADLMQILYEQDIDLGYNWRQSEPVKQLKDVDDIQKIKNDSMNVNDFFIDGETGEQIPIRANSVAEQAPVVPSNTQVDNGNSAINIDECLEILEHSMDDMQPRRPMSQTSIDERNNMVQNLNSLLLPTNNTTQINSAPHTEDLWQQIDHLSELTGLDLQVNQHVAPQSQNNLNGNYNYNGQLPTAPSQDQRNVNEQFNPNFIGQLPGSSPAYEPSVPQSFPISTFSSSNSPIQTPPQYMQSPLLSDDGIPMDTSFVQMESSNKEPSYPLNNFNNFNYQMDSSVSGGSPVSSLPEPGQGFFDYLQQDNNMNTDYVTSSSSMTNLSSSSSSSFLNPPVTNFLPPPLDTPSTSGGFMSETVVSSSPGKSAMIESYESDSGISLDQSPRGFDLFTLNPNEEVAFNAELAMVKADPSLSDQELSFSSPDLTAINHNHTYNGTVGVKKQEKKKLEKSAHPRESRDEKKARELNIPFTLDEIILSPVEEYNEMLARTPLNPAQQALIKDIRRRGKNKVAAQNCRKRKIETISNMEEDVEQMRSRKQQLVDEQKSLEAKFESMKLRYSSLYQQIFSSLRDDSGRPYDPSQFRLEQVEGAVLLVPRQMQEGSNGSDGCSNGEGIDFSKVKLEENL